MAESSPPSLGPAPLDPLVRRFVGVRRARDMAERLLGLGVLRLTEPPEWWWGGENACDVGSPASVEGFLLVHAGASPERVWAARERVRTEAAIPKLREARAQGLFPETTIRLMAVKLTPESAPEWLAAGMEARASGDFTEVNRLLRAAVRPAKVEELAAPQAPAAAEAPPDAAPASRPPHAPPRGETPSSVRARLSQQRDDRAAGRAPTTVLRLDTKVAFGAWQHDSWWQAAQRVRGERKDTPTSSLVFTAMLDHFGEAGAALAAPASLDDIEPERRVFVDPVPVPGRAGEAHRAWLSTNGGLLAIDAEELDRRGLRSPKVLVRRTRGKNVAPTESRLRAEFPELFWDPATEPCRARVRALLGYEADTPATWPEPRLPAHLQKQAESVQEDAVPVDVIERLDPSADALPDLSADETRAVTASAPRVGESLRWHELAALAALHEAERTGARPPGTVRRACEAEGMSERSRQEALGTWRQLATRPPLVAAFQAGLEYSMVRALARVEPDVVETWIAFARGRPVDVIQAHIAAQGTDGLPPVVPTGMEPLRPVGARVTEDIHVDLSPAQQQTLARLRAMLDRLHGRQLADAELYAAIAGWYVRRRTGVKNPRGTIVYQRSPETRVPIELRRESAAPTSAAALKSRRPGDLRPPASGLQPALAHHLPWVFAPESSVSGDWVEPVQKPGQDHTPAVAYQAVLDRDGPRCTTWYCPHDLVPTYNHGVCRRDGGIADPDTDQFQCLSCNNDHSNGALVVENRPDGGVWCWDGYGRRHGTVTPVARHLDEPLRRRLLDLAEQQLAAPPAASDATPSQVREPHARYGPPSGNARRTTHDAQRSLERGSPTAQRFAPSARAHGPLDTG